tara:strand:+ start:304 stop:1167 length:864 start_codon:yes stop_codon:yes gene_type:complete
MNILLTGSNGSIGQELKNLFLKNTNHILYLPIRKNIKSKKNKRLKYFFCDLEKSIKLKLKIDVIIHCASKNRQKFNDVKNTYNPNVLMTKNLIEFANNNMVKKIFFMSTMMVYKKFNKNKKIISENDHSKLDPYAKSKQKSESLFCNNKNSFKTVCIRLPGVLTNSSDNGPLLKKIAYKLKKDDEIKLFNLERKFNNLTDSFDIFRLIKLSLKSKSCNSIYQLASSKPMVFKKIIELMKTKVKSKSKVIELKNNINSFLISTKKIQKELKFKPSSTRNIVLRYCKSI